MSKAAKEPKLVKALSFGDKVELNGPDYYGKAIYIKKGGCGLGCLHHSKLYFILKDRFGEVREVSFLSNSLEAERINI